MSKYTLRDHEQADFIKWTIVFSLIFALICAVVLGGLQLFGKGKQKPSEWVKKSEEQTETLPDGNDNKADVWDELVDRSLAEN